MAKSIRNALIGAGLLALAGLGINEYRKTNYEVLVERPSREQNKISLPEMNLSSEKNITSSPAIVPEGPVYDSKTLPSTNCSRYVRLAAHDLFRIEYPRADAWEIRNGEGINERKVNSFEDLETLAKNGKLTPGMIIGLYNPASHYNTNFGAMAAGYTHVALFLGEENGKLYFADQFGKTIRTKMSETELAKKGLKPKEVLFKNN